MNSSRILFISLVVVLSVLLLYVMRAILTPFVTAVILAYLGNSLVSLFMRLKLGRTASVLLVYLLLIAMIVGLVVLLVPLLEAQLQVWIGNIPQLINWISDTALPWLVKHFNVSPDLLSVATIKTYLLAHWSQAGNVATKVFETLSKSGAAVFSWVADLLILPIVTFYLLRDWPYMVNAIADLLPRKSQGTVYQLARESDAVLGAFFRGQLMVMLSLAVIYSVGLWIVGLNTALLIGCIAGILYIIPYLGLALGIVAALVAAFFQFHDWHHLLYVGLVFLVGFATENVVLTPWLVGDSIGLHPVAVIFAVMAGGSLFGFVGILLALPVASVVLVLLRFVIRNYKESHLYQDDTSNNDMRALP